MRAGQGSQEALRQKWKEENNFVVSNHKCYDLGMKCKTIGSSERNVISKMSTNTETAAGCYFSSHLDKPHSRKPKGRITTVSVRD